MRILIIRILSTSGVKGLFGQLHPPDCRRATAGVLTWVHRIARIQVRERDLFGRIASRWRVIRTSNAYVFRDPQQRLQGVAASKSENRPGTLYQEFLPPNAAPPVDPDSPLERALAHFGTIIEERLLLNGSGGPVLPPDTGQRPFGDRNR